ncbi:hypothetical protein [Cryobacterium sp. GrIS_2_6]|uniref:hypothetical protein n=1 Tax=Cryobacterium sp. GrIS_2_6 TaxID=3162785 RepID=UPI002E01A6B6|nr:hypothetical protein [Cryobacterium psychrotolerans]MEC5149288.1 hypothetical protein [Cryobacterium psychrotolerans]MEC5149367.1 hypothetical protein [Cryobacterium psychrotolerans]
MPTKTNTRRTGADLARELIAITQRIDDASFGVGVYQFNAGPELAKFRARYAAAYEDMRALTVEISQI